MTPTPEAIEIPADVQEIVIPEGFAWHQARAKCAVSAADALLAALSDA